MCISETTGKFQATHQAPITHPTLYMITCRSANLVKWYIRAPCILNLQIDWTRAKSLCLHIREKRIQHACFRRYQRSWQVVLLKRSIMCMDRLITDSSRVPSCCSRTVLSSRGVRASRSWDRGSWTLGVQTWSTIRSHRWPFPITRVAHLVALSFQTQPSNQQGTSFYLLRTAEAKRQSLTWARRRAKKGRKQIQVSTRRKRRWSAKISMNWVAISNRIAVLDRHTATKRWKIKRTMTSPGLGFDLTQIV